LIGFDWLSVIYDPKRGDNESESAVLFGNFAIETSLSNDITTSVQHFINCTKSHTEIPTGNTELDYFLGSYHHHADIRRH